jgi:sarcosine oxidase subunit gamma
LTQKEGACVAEALKLEARSACAGLLPLKIGKVRAEEIVFEAVTSVALLAGKEAAVSKALKKQMGAELPAVGTTTGEAHKRIVWAGQEQFFVLGVALEPINGAAMTEQTDAWASAVLDGPGSRDVLARLVPIDLRDAAFPEGKAARTLLGHMQAVLMRTGPERYGIMVFRSMAKTFVHELKEAMETVAALGR